MAVARTGSFVLLLLVAAQAAVAQVRERDWFPGTSSIAERETIPPAYRGVWAPDAHYCREGEGARRLEVRANGLDLSEAGGRLERVTQAGAERSIRLRLSYEGEGEFWDRVETWTLNAPGDRLTIAVEGQSGAVTFIRCA